VNRNSEHSIAKAIVREAEKRGITLFESQDFQRIPGKGAKALIDNQKVLVGSEILVKEQGLAVKEITAVEIKELAFQGKTIVYVMVGNKLAGAIALADIIREESKEAIKVLHQQGIKVAMITGDSEDIAKWVAGELAIDEYFARVLPQQKAEKVKALQNRGLKVAMVGDGVNDAPALMQADLGIAIGAGTNVAIESAGIILVRNDPRDILKIIRLSKLTFRKMLQNLFWATGYNIVALPLAAGVFYFKGIILEPALAAIFMSISTIIVALNAMLLYRVKI
jgi:Cu2+-exporting ATPase